MEMFGPDFENYEQQTAEEKVKSSTQNAQVAVGKATKGKIAAKSTGLTYQFQIMESIGVPRTEIKKFADPYHWLTYFPPICIVSAMLWSFPAILKLRHSRRTTDRLARV
jgi:leucyl-tRNA synthetase